MLLTEHSDPINAIVARAQQVIRAASQRQTQLRDPTLIKAWNRNYVIRCRVDPPTDGCSSVVIKQIKQRGAHGYNDWAGVHMLSALSIMPPISPRFIGGDRNAGLLVMEDLGTGSTLEDVLNGTDEARASAALQAVAITTARMHGATVGREAAYDRLRSALDQAYEAPRVEQARQLLAQQSDLRARWAAVGLVLNPAVERECEQIAATGAQPGPLLVYTHGDMAPSNSYFTPHGARLIDFEYGGYRHALYDSLLWHIICPFPTHVIQQVEAAYREELAHHIPAASDDERYTRDLIHLSAYHVLFFMLATLPTLLAENKPWAGAMTARPAIMLKLRAFQTLAAQHNAVPALSAAIDQLSEVLATRWAADLVTVPVWRAFANGTDTPTIF